MKKETVETLSELYAIRAVMSYVSNNDDETHGIITKKTLTLIQQIDRIRKTIDDTEREIEEKHTHKPEIEELEGIIKQEKEKKAEIEKAIESDRERLSKGVGENVKYCLFFIFIYSLFAFFASVFVNVFLILVFDIGNYKVLFLFEFIIYLIGAVVCFAYNFIKSRESDVLQLKSDRKKLEDIEKVLAKYYTQKAELTGGMRKGDKYTPKGLELMAEIEKKKQEIKAIESEIDEGFKRVDIIKMQSAEIVRKAKRFFDMVNFRDWDGLDLICYYIETGRADTVKEVLIKIDTERMNDSFEPTLRYANEQICQSACYAEGEIKSGIEGVLSEFVSFLNSRHEEDEDLVNKVEGEAAEEVEVDNPVFRNYCVQEFTDALNEKMDIASKYLADDIQTQLRVQETTN